MIALLEIIVEFWKDDSVAVFDDKLDAVNDDNKTVLMIAVDVVNDDIPTVLDVRDDTIAELTFNVHMDVVSAKPDVSFIVEAERDE